MDFVRRGDVTLLSLHAPPSALHGISCSNESQNKYCYCPGHFFLTLEIARGNTVAIREQQNFHPCVFTSPLSALRGILSFRQILLLFGTFFFTFAIASGNTVAKREQQNLSSRFLFPFRQPCSNGSQNKYCYCPECFFFLYF